MNMAIRYYAPGDHGSGFIGFRVTVVFNKNYRQSYFSTSRAENHNESDVHFRYEKLKAELQEATWQADSFLHQYRVFVSQNHSTTKPFRGVGVHGITCHFFRDRRNSWQAAFNVQPSTGHPKTFTFCSRSFTETWIAAVEFWAEQHGILNDDTQRVLTSPPLPAQFKELRRHLNNEHRYDIPVETLSPVFAEQREEILQKKAAKKRQHYNREEGSGSSASQKAAAVISEWFETELSRNS
jgi:hypothetical protein